MAKANPAQTPTPDATPPVAPEATPESTVREDGVRVTELPGGTIREDY